MRRNSLSSSNPSSSLPRRQGLLSSQTMLPIIVAAITGISGSIIPTILDFVVAFKQDVDVQDVPFAKRNNELFAKNFVTCTSSEQYDYVTRHDNAVISTKLCPSGDVLVKYEAPNAQPTYQFVALGTTEQQSWLDFLVPAAHAAVAEIDAMQVKQSAPTVICQKVIADGRLLRRLRYSDGRCEDEVINTYSGEVVSTESATCDANCN